MTPYGVVKRKLTLITISMFQVQGSGLMLLQRNRFDGNAAYVNNESKRNIRPLMI